MEDAKRDLLGEGSPISLKEIAQNFLVLGTTAFGGPPVHFGMFQERFVERQKWLSSSRYTELIAMANCLPGPSSTQVAFALGVLQQGVLGGLVSGFSFLLPGAILLTLLGFGASSLQDEVEDPKSTANAVAAACSAVGVALVFIAVTGLVKKQVEGAKKGMICFVAASILLVWQPAPQWLNPALILVGGAITAVLPVSDSSNGTSLPPGGRTGLPVAAAIFIFILYMVVASWTIYDNISDRGWLIPFLTAGMFVWGGGPVVLPMLMVSLCKETPGEAPWVSQNIFLMGIAIAEMMPGPVFNLSCFLGVQLALKSGMHWLVGTTLAWLGLVGPGVVLIFGAIPLWDKLRGLRVYQNALPGLNAAAVGLLVQTIFIVYAAMEKKSPWPAGSRAVALCSYAAVDIMKINVPAVVVVAGLAGFLWSVVPGML
mmetsp:Transcript_8138/g.17749  ORF Transcript_8138/g.17749 Transcript_8138/m.17749 type:complete len:428 (-) Transcript_8138:167-1450(-)